MRCPRGRIWTSRWIYAATHRRTGDGTATSSTTSATASSWFRSGSRTGSASSAKPPTSLTSCRAITTSTRSRGSRGRSRRRVAGQPAAALRARSRRAAPGRDRRRASLVRRPTLTSARGRYQLRDRREAVFSAESRPSTSSVAAIEASRSCAGSLCEPSWSRTTSPSPARWRGAPAAGRGPAPVVAGDRPQQRDVAPVS